MGLGLAWRVLRRLAWRSPLVLQASELMDAYKARQAGVSAEPGCPLFAGLRPETRICRELAFGMVARICSRGIKRRKRFCRQAGWARQAPGSIVERNKRCDLGLLVR